MRLQQTNFALHLIPQVPNFVLVVQPPPQPPLITRRVRWQPPPPGFVKLNFDGSVFAKDNKVGAGTIIQNSNELVPASQSQLINQAYSPLAIEAITALYGLQLAMELSFTHAVLEADYLSLLSALQYDSDILSPDGLLIDDKLLTLI